MVLCTLAHCANSTLARFRPFTLLPFPPLTPYCPTACPAYLSPLPFRGGGKGGEAFFFFYMTSSFPSHRASLPSSPRGRGLGGWGFLIVILAVTSLLDCAEAVYASVPFALLWGVVAVVGTVAVVRARLWRMPATLLLHAALLVILCGALATRLTAEHGSLSLRTGEATRTFDLDGGGTATLPFALRLDTFRMAYYPGTRSPQDYTSCLTIADGTATRRAEVSMNRIHSYRHYRFYQAGFSPDGRGSKLTVAHDPYGIAITYTGYALLLVAMLLFFAQPGTLYRRILRRRVAALLLLGLTGTATARAANMPRIAPTDVAHELGGLYLYYNGRVCPLQTYAYDFTAKLCGRTAYRGRTPEEVLAGWLFFPDTWKPEPMIGIKGEARRRLGTTARRVSLLDFANARGEYKLAAVVALINRGQRVAGQRDLLAADEKVGVVNGLFTGAALKLFPVRQKDGTVQWYAPVDDLPHDLDIGRWTFIKKSLALLSEHVVMGRHAEARRLIGKIRAYQRAECGAQLPTDAAIRAERAYNRIAPVRPWAMGCLAAGLVGFVVAVVLTARRHPMPRAATVALVLAVAVVWAYLTVCMGLRTVVSRHLPVANGFETMQALAWSCLALTLVLRRRFGFALPFGLIVAGLALLVSMMGQSNPAITHLMPVLNSPLLSLHVMVIMVAYALLAFTMLGGLTALVFSRMPGGMAVEVRRLQRMGQLMLWPAVFLLTAGIFIGAVWANISWGRYWSWDPKETWALITLLVYALPLHARSLPALARPLVFHAYMVVAFLSILMTYFGVNFVLGGMHAYA